MKKQFILIVLFLAMSIPSGVFAQSMPVLSGVEGMGRQFPSPTDDHTAREEAEGKEIWEKLQAKQLACDDLSDDNYEVLGEYVMGQSIGTTGRHAVMNQMMINMMGEAGEEQMHISLGKRSSGCDTYAPFPSGYGLPMMGWMMGSAFTPGSYGRTKGGGNPMTGSGWGKKMDGWDRFSPLGWLTVLLFWILLILGVIALIRYLARSGQDKRNKTSLDILKERYAKGEIDKREFEAKKKDLL